MAIYDVLCCETVVCPLLFEAELQIATSFSFYQYPKRMGASDSNDKTRPRLRECLPPNFLGFPDPFR